ncbi:MAG: pyridine nucleotide-disulfide oxidoreductase, partial [Bacteroidota bacterium]
QQGVHVMEQTKVDDVRFHETFDISISSRLHTDKKINSRVCISAHGKRSNIDVRLKRSFLSDGSHGLHNYVGVKYHLQSSWPANTIGLHNFKNGYCGISKIEDDKTSFCYMTTAQNLKQCNNNIPLLEEKVLSQNPHLKKIFAESIVDKQFPSTISQISFSKKTQVENGMLMIGDAAGMITPLCGNGMSMALHSAKLATEIVTLFLAGKINRSQMENNYAANWKQQFASRLKTGRTLQRFFGSPFLSNAFVGLFKTFPFLAKPVIRQTHGVNF